MNSSTRCRRRDRANRRCLRRRSTITRSGVAERRRGRRGLTPALRLARRRSCARMRRSLASCSAGSPFTVRARTVTVAESSSAVTSTSAPSNASLSRSTTALRSAASGTRTVASASCPRLTIVAFRIVSEARRSFGITRRMSSRVRIIVKVRPISSTTPASSPISTQSPSRSGCASAIRIPATKFASVDRAAKPTTSPMIAEDARIPPATARTSGMTSSADRTPMNTINATSARRRTR